jgi:DNA-binding NarL/FixJ family response regulator
MRLKAMSKLVRTDLVDRLAPREMQVFRRIADGLTVHQIGLEMGISFKTVEVHRRNIQRKLKLHNSNQVLRMAVLWVFVYGDRVPENMEGRL